MNVYRLTSQQVPPLVRETRIVSRITQQRDWSRYEEPAYKRNPGFVARSRERHKRPVVKVQAISMFHRKQA